MQNKYKNIALSLVAIFFWILFWQIAASIANHNLIFNIPLPLETLKEFISDVKTLSFWNCVFNSLWHILSGFIAGVLLGLIFGVLSGNSNLFKILTAPVSRLVRSVPVAALVILAWLWIPSELIPTFIVFLMVLPIVWLQVETAFFSIDFRLIEMAKVMGMSNKLILKNIKVPTILPYFREACINGLGFAWKSGLAAEVICNPTGSLGALLSNAKSNLEYSKVFAIIVMIVILSLILENIIKFFWRKPKYD